MGLTLSEVCKYVRLLLELQDQRQEETTASVESVQLSQAASIAPRKADASTPSSLPASSINRQVTEQGARPQPLEKSADDVTQAQARLLWHSRTTFMLCLPSSCCIAC